MRVAHLLEKVGVVGGVPTYLEGLLPGLRARGVDGVIVTADNIESFAGTRCIRATAVSANRAKLTQDERAHLVEAIVDARVDVAYAHVTRSADVLATVSELVPTIFYAHDYYPVCPGSMRYLHRSERFCADGAGLRCFWRAYTELSTSRRPDRILREYTRVKGWSPVWERLARVFVASPFVADVLVADGVPRELLRVLPYFAEPSQVQRPPEPGPMSYSWAA